MSSASRATGNRRVRDGTGPTGPARGSGRGSGKGGKGSGKEAGRARGKSSRLTDPLEVTLEHARWRHFSWALACLVIGSALIVKLGVVGKMVGVILLIIAARSTYLFVRTLLTESGTIRVDKKAVSLPVGLCRGAAHTVPTEDLRHVYYLRRAVPWNRTAPLLVIESEERAFTYPRDWFTSDVDQRRVFQTVQKHIERLADRQDEPAGTRETKPQEAPARGAE